MDLAGESSNSAESTATPRAPFSQKHVVLLLGIALAAVFPRVWFGLGTFFYRDFGVLAYPTIFYQRECFWRGELPLWNPYSNCGAPFLAQWGTMVLYPFSLFYLLLPVPWSLNVFCLAHLCWGGTGMSALAARWTGSRFAGGVAAVAFIFNGVTLSSLMWPNYSVALGWMPWVVFCVDRVLAERDRRKIVLASLAAGMQLFSGVPEIVLQTWMLIGAVCAMRLAASQAKAAPICRISFVVLIAAGLAAAQLLPFIQLLQHSQRIGNADAIKWALPLASLGNFVLPMFRCALSPQGMFFQLDQGFFASTYLGLIPLGMALLALRFQRETKVWALACLCVLSVLLALADSGGLHPVLRWLLPSLGLMRYPIKFVILTAFGLPLLAAYGYLTLRSQTEGARQSVLKFALFILSLLAAGVVALLLIGRKFPTIYEHHEVVLQCALWRIGILIGSGLLLVLHAKDRGARRAAVLAGGLFVLLIGDALVGVPDKNPVLPASVLAPGFWELQNKGQMPKLGEGRFMISPAAEGQLLNSRVGNLEGDLVGKRLALWSHLNLLDGGAKVNGSSTLQLKEQKKIESILYASTNTDYPNLRRFLNVAYMTAPGKVIDWQTASDPLPLITAGQKPLFRDAPETLAGLTNSAFDPSKLVYLPPETRAQVQATNATSANVNSVQVSAHRLSFAIEAAGPGMVVVAQTFYSPWRAQVDGQATPMWRANYAFQALQVPAGRHEVEIRYQDDAFRLGVLISLGTVLACALLWRSSPSHRSGVVSRGSTAARSNAPGAFDPPPD